MAQQGFPSLPKGEIVGIDDVIVGAIVRCSVVGCNWCQPIFLIVECVASGLIMYECDRWFWSNLPSDIFVDVNMLCMVAISNELMNMLVW